MSDNAQYAAEALAHCGFVVAHAGLAGQLRADIYEHRSSLLFTFAPDVERVARKRGAKLYRARVEGIQEPVPVWSVSPASLAQRLEWVLGLRVPEVTQANESEKAGTPRPSFNARSVQHQQDERRMRLERLAAQEPPVHDCSLRREILNARRDLGMKAEG